MIRKLSEDGTSSGSELTLDVQNVSMGGQCYRVSTKGVTQQTEGIVANKRTAEMIGGGAVLGMLLLQAVEKAPRSAQLGAQRREARLRCSPKAEKSKCPQRPYLPSGWISRCGCKR